MLITLLPFVTALNPAVPVEYRLSRINYTSNVHCKEQLEWAWDRIKDTCTGTNTHDDPVLSYDVDYWWPENMPQTVVATPYAVHKCRVRRPYNGCERDVLQQHMNGDFLMICDVFVEVMGDWPDNIGRCLSLLQGSSYEIAKITTKWRHSVRALYAPQQVKMPDLIVFDVGASGDSHWFQSSSGSSS